MTEFERVGQSFNIDIGNIQKNGAQKETLHRASSAMGLEAGQFFIDEGEKNEQCESEASLSN